MARSKRSNSRILAWSMVALTAVCDVISASSNLDFIVTRSSNPGFWGLALAFVVKHSGQISPLILIASFTWLFLLERWRNEAAYEPLVHEPDRLVNRLKTTQDQVSKLLAAVEELEKLVPEIRPRLEKNDSRLDGVGARFDQFSKTLPKISAVIAIRVLLPFVDVVVNLLHRETRLNMLRLNNDQRETFARLVIGLGECLEEAARASGIFEVPDTTPSDYAPFLDGTAGSFWQQNTYAITRTLFVAQHVKARLSPVSSQLLGELVS